jgi:SAM-dependent methyltransferase
MIGKQCEYEAMAKCEKELWWYKFLHDLTLKKINQIAGKNAAILDAGCGTGGMLAQLTKLGFMNTSGFDLSTDAIDYTVRSGYSNVQLLNILDCDSAYPLNSFDVIICNDILCLLNDGEDKVAFEKLVSLLKPGGSLIMNLPAGRFFKGTHDHAVGIKKRYSKKKVRQLAEDQLVEINEVYRWPFLLSPLIFLLRLFQRGKLLFFGAKEYKSDVSLPHPILNNLFYGLTSFENKIIGPKPWGSSIFVTVMKL